MNTKTKKYLAISGGALFVFWIFFSGSEDENVAQVAVQADTVEATPPVDSASQVNAEIDLKDETSAEAVAAEVETNEVDSEGLLAEWFSKHDYLVLIMETLTDRNSSSLRELSADCEVALEQDLRENEPSDILARMGNKIHVYLSSGDSESFVELEPHPNCVAAFGGAPGGPQLCPELRQKKSARVVVNDKGVPVSYTSNWVKWDIDATNFSEDNRVVGLNATSNGERLRAFAYVCGYN